MVVSVCSIGTSASSYPQPSCQRPWALRRHHSPRRRRRRQLLPLNRTELQATSEKKAVIVSRRSAICCSWEWLAIRAAKPGRPRTAVARLVLLASGCLGVVENFGHERFVAGLLRQNCAASDAALGKTLLCCAMRRRRRSVDVVEGLPGKVGSSRLLLSTRGTRSV
jgi:hypothetical protein